MSLTSRKLCGSSFGAALPKIQRTHGSIMVGHKAGVMR